jgi:hypothetical protein
MTKRQNRSNNTLFTENLERRTLYGLSLEYDNALFFMDPIYASKMKKPLFRLSPTQHQLGAWHSVKREISISRNLVLFHPWDTVKEVLLHEMAHQMTDEVFKVREEPAHGPTFHKACKLLRANPKATRHYPHLHTRSQGDISSRQHRLLSRVKKLMALSNSKNSHEAVSAMTKAHELIQKYNLPLLENRNITSFTTMFLGKPALRHYREDYLLAHLLIEFYFIEGLWIPSYVMEKAKMGRVFEVSGTLTNVEIAAYVYDCVKNYIESQWKHFSCGQKLGRFKKSDFAVGIITGFHQKLIDEEYSKTLSPTEKMLILSGDPQLKAYMKDRHPHTRSIRRSVANMDSDIYSKGLKKGKHLSLMKGIKETSLAKMKLLSR